MSKKLLSVSIAAYNMEKYILQTLDSCVIDDYMNELEILIINDGSTDHTSDIAKEYVEKYPNIFRLIEKENGGYGTTVNMGIENATGKYFRLLDGDDWFDNAGMREYLSYLKKTDCDWIITKYAKYYDDTKQIEDGYNGKIWKEEYFGKIYHIEMDSVYFRGGIWTVTMRTDIVKQHVPPLPMHCLYTDTLFLFYCMPFVKTVCFLETTTYLYRKNRPNQSVDVKNMVKHISDQILVHHKMLKFFLKCKEIKNSMEIRAWLIPRLAGEYNMLLLKIFLLPDRGKGLYLLKREEKLIKRIAPLAYKEIASIRSGMLWLRKSYYLLYRPYVWYENRFTDKQRECLKKAFINIFSKSE